MKFKPCIFSLIILLISAFQIKAQDNSRESQFDLVKESKNWLEGFNKNIGDHEFTYGSFRSDVTASIISRCKNGETTIEWETAIVPKDFQQKELGFLWMAAIDLTTEKQVFEIYFNGEKYFEINTSTKKNWQIKNSDGSKLSFYTVETDGNGDAFGYMWLTVPTEMVIKGTEQKIKIEGRANNSYSWIIVYQATDALSYLQNSIKYNVSLKLIFEAKDKKLTGQIIAPLHLSGKTLNYTANKKNGTVQLKRTGNISTGEIILPLSAKNKKFELQDTNGKLLLTETLCNNLKTLKLIDPVIITIASKNANNKTIITADRKYNPKTITSLLKLSESVLSRGKIYLMNSSHQDIAWMDSPSKCIIQRDTMLLTPLLELAQKDKSYRFDVEDALILKEFIERHPDKKVLIKEMLQSGQISCGSAFSQPYEEMYSGESLARQFYFGTKWLKDEFDYNATVYWNEDVPGRTLQMMQLMRKAGTKYLMISRFERGLYNWYSPDGSYVTAFTPGHYGNAFNALQKDFNEAVQFIATSSLSWEGFYSEKSKSPVIPLLSVKDMSHATNYSQMLRKWKEIDKLQTKKGENIQLKLPALTYASAHEFFQALTTENPIIKNIKGERPDVWLYIHGPAHQKALKVSREADILLTQAEKFSTANALVENSFKNYSSRELEKAWEAKIYPDHGWGGKNGDITDALFKEKYEFAKARAEEVLDKSLNNIAAKIETDKKQGRPLVVFNSMNYERTDPVSIAVRFDTPGTFSVKLADMSGKKIDVQLSKLDYFPDGSIKNAKINFIAKQVPPIGYKTWYLTPSPEKPVWKMPEFHNKWENSFYLIKFGNGGLTSIFDKELNKELIDPGKFKAGEVFTMHSVGFGAGEFADIQKPDMEGFDKTGNYKTVWTVEESGSVYISIKYRQKIRNAVVEQRIKIYNQQKRIDFETALINWEGVLYREFRMALPLNMTKGQVAYEVPFGVVEVGKDELKGAAGERYKTDCKNLHPRGIENWISASNRDFGVTMSSTVAVADWIDPTDNPVDNQILQPILLASRRSCHWEGNEYLQTGNHHFLFSITSHKPGWQNGANNARGANETLKAVWADNSFEDTSLPESLSFFSVDNSDVFISTIKKAEDSNDIIIRLTNMDSTGIDVTLQSFKEIKSAIKTNLIEEDLNTVPTEKHSVIIELGHQSIETIKLK